MYPGLHQSSSNANSQGQASGWSLNRGTSVMAPAPAQLTLTPAQENEDNKSQEQADKAKRVLFESTGNEVIKDYLPATNILNSFVFFCLNKTIVCLVVCFFSILRFGVCGCIQLRIHDQQGVASPRCKIVQFPIIITTRGQMTDCPL